MKIREVAHKAENLIERGESAKQRQVYYQHAASSARSQLMAAYAMLDAASQTDEDGNPITYTGMGVSMGLASQPLSFVDALSECVS